eukprot:3286756-Amphidinium_carterae.1
MAVFLQLMVGTTTRQKQFPNVLLSPGQTPAVICCIGFKKLDHLKAEVRSSKCVEGCLVEESLSRLAWNTMHKKTLRQAGALKMKVGVLRRLRTRVQTVN